MPNKEELLSFIRRSKRRKDILKLLLNQSLTATDIEKVTKMYKSHVSRALLELRKYELVICKNPNDRVFRYYKITNKGRQSVEKIK